MHPTATTLFRHGVFLGDSTARRESASFAFQDMVPTVPACEVPRHTHDAGHFVFLVSGTYISTAAGAPPVAEQPLLIYNPPGTTHRDRFQSLAGRFFSVSIPAITQRLLEQECAVPDRPTAWAEGYPLAVARKLRRECLKWDGQAAEAGAMELMTAIAVRPSTLHRHPPRWLSVVRQMLEEDEDATLDGAAQCAGVHPVHLIRTFREFHGATPAEYRRERKLRKAAVRLASKRGSIADIAIDVGFADQSHFTRAFHRLYGIPPAAYRRLHVDFVQDPSREAGPYSNE